MTRGAAAAHSAVSSSKRPPGARHCQTAVVPAAPMLEVSFLISECPPDGARERLGRFLICPEHLTFQSAPTLFWATILLPFVCGCCCLRLAARLHCLWNSAHWQRQYARRDPSEPIGR